MKFHRFIGDFDLSADKISITGDIAEQIRSVLRLKAGDVVLLGNGSGKEASARIASLGRGKANLEIIEVSFPQRELKSRVVLFASVIKKENFEFVVQKAVECGVSKIIPVISDRTVKLGLNMERLKKIIREASEQSGRTMIPEISNPLSFSESLNMAEGRKILFHPEGKEFIPSLSGTGTVSAFIGPEGGFSDREIEESRAAGAEIISIGKLTLRAETAATIVSFISRYA